MQIKFEQFNDSNENKENIFEKVSQHSIEFDNEIKENPLYTQEEIEASFKIENWKFNETEIVAIGVSHVPETFLYFRDKIEESIKNSDIIINEFAPEAQGVYSKGQIEELKKIRSKYNENYNLEQLRQMYLKYERVSNMGVFHHEVELLAAKYGKEMATADIRWSKNTEGILQDDYFFSKMAEENDQKIANLKKLGLYTGSIALTLSGVAKFIKDFKEPISRRSFLEGMFLSVTGLAVAVSADKLTESPPQTTMEKVEEENVNFRKGMMTERARDLKLARSIQELSMGGHRKIAFIYGVNHLDYVKRYLDDIYNPYIDTEDNLYIDPEEYNSIISEVNSDSFKIYELVEGENDSEMFKASDKMKWSRKE
ncbi:MAG: hypothetical protein WC095_00785 [Candidatus Paceibacterota bacterium]